MNSNYLDFEQPIAELQAKIDELRNVGSDNAINLDEEIQRLQAKMRQKIKGIFKDLTPWQISQLSRHPLRPYTLDYVEKIFDEFHELHGDRAMVRELDKLLTAFVAQRRMRLAADTYEPCYKLLA